MIKAIISDVWHVLFFPKDFELRGHSDEVRAKIKNGGTADFFATYFINQELLDYLGHLKKEQHLTLALFSSGTMYKEPQLQPLLSPLFDHAYCSGEIGFQKSNPDSYQYLSEQLSTPLSAMLFIDDSMRNIEAAREAGINAIHYHHNDQVFKAVDEILNR